MNFKGFYFITDARLSRAGNESDVRSAVDAGVMAVQYRNKDASSRTLHEEALKLKRICHGHALFIVNDRIDIALSVNADGVHLGQDDMPLPDARKILGPLAVIGITVHNEEEAERAIKEGADYLGLSPVFPTSTKHDAGLPAGLSLITRIRSLTSVPLVAIGGINLENAGHVISAGADSFCAISATVAQDNVHAEILKFQNLFLFC